MKYVLTLALTLIMIGCSKNGPKGVDDSNIISEKNNEIVMSPLTMNVGTIISLDGDMEVAFGSIMKGFKAIKSINIINQKNESINIDYNSAASNLGLIVVKNGCPSVLETQRSCSITLEINPNVMALGSFNQTITVQELEIPVTGTIIENVNEQFTLQKPISNMGQVIRGEKIERIYVLYNETRSNKDISISHNLGSSVQFKGCYNQSLKPKKGCYVKVIIDLSSYAIGIENKEISISGIDDNFSFEVINPESSTELGLHPIANNANFGTVNDIGQATNVITFVNNSGKPIASTNFDVSPPYSIDVANSTCLTRPIYFKRQCSVKIVADSTNMTVGVHNSQIKLTTGINNQIASAPVNASFTITGNPCTGSKMQIGGVCVLTNQSQACSLQPANSNGGVESSTNGGQTFGSCHDYICNENYTNVNGSCVLTNQSQACTPQPSNSIDGLQSSTNGGVSFGSCTGYTCVEDYMNVGGSCVSIYQTQNCSTNPANSIGGYEESTDGGQTFGSCKNYSCESGYFLHNGACIANTVLNCTDPTTCYQKKAIYNKANFVDENGTQPLITFNGFLYNANTSQYYGTQCNAWYSQAEFVWINRKLDGKKTNWLNIQYAFNSDENRTNPSSTYVTSTCGTVYFGEYRPRTNAGYAYLYVNGGAAVYGTTPHSNGGGSGWFYNNTAIPVSKGASLQIHSHYYAIGYLSSGY